jgi:hypothetical protein
MLNLSDKELDRLSKEAAQEYEPGEVLGPRSWERLEVRLDNTPGGVNPNPLRHIRRFPFYYAPALLVLIGVSYYFVKQGTKGSGSPPTFGMAKTPGPAPVEKNLSSTANPVYPDKSTPVPPSSVNPSSPDVPGGSGASAGAVGNSTSASSTAAAPAVTSASGASSSGTSSSGSAAPGASAHGSSASGSSAADANAIAARNLTGSKTATGSGRNRSSASNNHNRTPGQNGGLGPNGTPGRTGVANGNTTDAAGTNPANAAATNAGNLAGTNTGKTGSPTGELNRSTIGGLARTKNNVLIPDSNLRKFTLKSLPQGMQPRAMYVNRNLQIGLVLAPDFTSVNSLAGNRPGSTVGLTLDYQFVPRLYISTGLLLDRKNYAARAQDYHAPVDFYQNNIFARHLDYVKGTFEMLEIPLNLRYDFSVTGSTLFFASAGVSSYLLTSENSGMYGTPWGYQTYQPCPSTGQHSYLFSAANLSLGVETGLSNSLSLLIAPYMKIPTRGIGFGQVQMSSVGINFALKFAPVISRKRK